MTKKHTHWYLFYKTEILIMPQEDGSYTIPTGTLPPVKLAEEQVTHTLTISKNGSTQVKTATLDRPLAEELRKKYELCDLRKSYYKLSAEHYQIAGKCREFLYWDQNTRFCGTCGTPMEMYSENSKRCPHCGKEVWPQVSPAVIVLIHKKGKDAVGLSRQNGQGNPEEEEVLLVQARNFRTNFFGLVAGFVETGETLEEAVHREVMEETGITITNLRYFGSQPWPYPSGLMVGFHADYVSGDIHLQHSELKNGNWFTKDQLPTLPEKLSIARKLIDDWLENGNS